MIPREVALVIDTHHHVGELALGVTGEGGGRSDQDPAGTHRAMLARFGMAAACVLPGMQYERPHGIVNTRAVNDAIAAYRDADPRHFPVALGVVEPLHGLDLCRKEMARAAHELRLDGFVWHTRYQGVALSDRRMHALIDEATALGLPCYLHVFSESAVEAPWMLGELAKQHPDARLVALDGFSGATQIHYIMDLADRYEHLLFDTAVCFPLLRPLETFIARFGSERLLFGTDSYADPVTYNTPSVLNELLASELPQEDLDNVMWRNFERLFPQARARRTGEEG
ncbi:amidohydrolase family protein [Streptomyces sp. NPDC047043]|uniref:amidohydrolase family protein n=1 Tax=Streptomyces sp. NPDC047043 TaxID=3154497 RepID=UPI00340063DF